MVPEGAGGITVQASIGTMTKVSYDGASTSFTDGDQIAVYAWTGSAASVPAKRVVNGEVNTFDGTVWTPANQMDWDGMTKAHYFLGISPVAAVTDFTADPYTLNPSKYTDSDLLIATSLDGITPSATPVDLAFTHAMAKLNVNLKFRSEFGGTPAVTGVTVKAKNTATVNYLTKVVTATGDASEVDIPAAASPATGYALSFSGLQVPQTGVSTVNVTIDGKQYLYESDTEIPLVGGQYTTMGLIVGKDKLDLASVEVSNWTTGTDLPGGEAIMQIVHDYVDMGEVEINGVKKHLYWATCNIGADNPWDYGDYYAWGETATKHTYLFSTYAFGSSAPFSRYTGSDYATLLAEDDAATTIWGGEWRLPTDAEWTALHDDTLYDWAWKTDYNGSGKNGMLVTRKTGTGPCAGNSIFLPAAGIWGGDNVGLAGSKGGYWSSSHHTGSSESAWKVQFESDGTATHKVSYRYYGLSIRPVFCERYPLAAVDVATIDIGKVLAADGNIYADAAQASAAGTTARAVIAYVGSVPNYFDKFLAIALTDVDDSKHSWTDAHMVVGTFAGTHAINIGATTYNTNAVGATYYDQVADNASVPSATRTTSVVKGWRIPSVTDWRYIFEGIGGLTVASQSAGVSDCMDYGNDSDIRNAINAACGNTALQSDGYWNSSENYDDSLYAWEYNFHWGKLYSFYKANNDYVRPVFAY
jgi:hypothetical protein